MIVAIEVAVGYLVEHTLPGIVVQHQTAKHRLLSLDGVWRHLERGGFQIVLLGTLMSFMALEIRNYGKNKGHVPLARKRARCYSSGTSGARRQQPATTISLTVASTSVCRCTATSYSPVWRMVPFGRRTSLLATSTPEANQGIGDVGSADGTEQLALIARGSVMVTSSSAS